MGRAIGWTLLVAGALSVATASQAAQEGRKAGAAAARPNRVPGDLPPGEVVAILDGYELVQAQDALQLTDTQYGSFVSRLKKLQDTRRHNQQARNQILQELRKLIGPQATTPLDEPAIRERLKALRDHDDRASAELRKAYDALDEVMDARQQARFRLFEEQIERRKLDLLMRARQAARRGGT